MLFKNRDEKFCHSCLSWYNNSLSANTHGDTDKHITGDCAPLTRGDLNKALKEIKEMIKE